MSVHHEKVLHISYFLIFLTSYEKYNAIPYGIKIIMFHEAKVYIKSYLDRGRNMDPSMNTEPERSMYQLVANSPVLKKLYI